MQAAPEERERETGYADQSPHIDARPAVPDDTPPTGDETASASATPDLDDETEAEPDLIADDDVITIKRSHFYAAVAPVTFVLGLAVGYLLWGNGQPQVPAGAVAGETAASVAAAQPAAVPAPPQAPQRMEVSVDDDPAHGPANAPVTIIEFSDFQCPFCARFHQETLRALFDAYPNQIYFVYRDFPLTSIHPEAQPAAEAAQCAHEQGKFWQYHDLLFQNQGALGAEFYFQVAGFLELNTAAFEECVSSQRYAAEVQADLAYGIRLGITGTPTFFVNGIPVVGAQPFEVFASIIDQELGAQ